MHDIRVEQRRVLGNYPDILTQAFQLHLVDVLVIDEDLPRCRVVEAVEKAEDGGFTAARGTDNGDFLAGRDGE